MNKEISVFRIWVYNGNNTPLKERMCDKMFADIDALEDYRRRLEGMYNRIRGCDVTVFFGYSDPESSKRYGKRFEMAAAKKNKSLQT